MTDPAIIRINTQAQIAANMDALSNLRKAMEVLRAARMDYGHAMATLEQEERALLDAIVALRESL